ncbi:PfkB family carbohydrate kinase [Parapedobacter tibetensis]|uniref:PfkB family carbohydrate kinase n=1 Tax=Parapedobacter tibetensis TaxID=2972951 RepID=UPI00214DDFF5|nr:PfkB family carbohydrate kinase [Parapedobacter tibetensis]
MEPLKYDICCIGHVTKDRVITPNASAHMPGGTAHYFSNALAQLDVTFSLITSLATHDRFLLDDTSQRVPSITIIPTKRTHYFENRYSDNPDHRTQRVLSQSDPFYLSALPDLEASIYHFGPLLAQDIPVDMIKAASEKGIVSLDIQGYLREVRAGKVYYTDWKDKYDVLPYIDILKANYEEARILTGRKKLKDSMKALADWGVKEAIITLGSNGSIIYSNGIYHCIPAYSPQNALDATGCGDTYMAGYLYQKIKGASIQEAGVFGAAMATLKIDRYGPFIGNENDVKAVIGKAQTIAHSSHVLL